MVSTRPFLVFSLWPSLPSISPLFLIQQSNHNFKISEIITLFHPYTLRMDTCEKPFPLSPQESWPLLSFKTWTQCSYLWLRYSLPRQNEVGTKASFLQSLWFVLTREEAQRKGLLPLFLNVQKALFRKCTSCVFQTADLGQGVGITVRRILPQNNEEL